jgi:hypothetical protein
MLARANGCRGYLDAQPPRIPRGKSPWSVDSLVGMVVASATSLIRVWQ